MTSRMHNDVTQAYVAALQQRGVKVRLVTDQTDMQDFCVLKSAQKELVGCAKSTFLLWAAYLGDMQRVRMYLVENSDAATQAFVKREAKRFSKYTNPKLKDRMQIQLYPNEEVEAMRQDASKH
uniref:Uncharacterized protein n=1 Tax=Craspedostauros australis TaxID=1486917 RepID=A0A7S0F791_9STRA|mmetsp:Transcript_9883/g.26971  ORF Transcript_9883/g.26971 Transcript_9883/m.26971 type:complete len:123 (+) Transcript_9883:331-699(+)